MKQMKRTVMLVIGALLTSANLFASEADIAIPDLHAGEFHIFGQAISSWDFLFYGALVICVTLSISLWLFSQVKKLRAHDSMLKVSEIIFQTCRTYLLQQGKFLLMLFAFVAVIMSYYFLALQGKSVGTLLYVLFYEHKKVKYYLINNKT